MFRWARRMLLQRLELLRATATTQPLSTTSTSWLPPCASTYYTTLYHSIHLLSLLLWHWCVSTQVELLLLSRHHLVQGSPYLYKGSLSLYVPLWPLLHTFLPLHLPLSSSLFHSWLLHFSQLSSNSFSDFILRRIAIDDERLVLAFETLDVESKGKTDRHTNTNTDLDIFLLGQFDCAKSEKSWNSFRLSAIGTWMQSSLTYHCFSVHFAYVQAIWMRML